MIKNIYKDLDKAKLFLDKKDYLNSEIILKKYLFILVHKYYIKDYNVKLIILYCIKELSKVYKINGDLKKGEICFKLLNIFITLIKSQKNKLDFNNNISNIKDKKSFFDYRIEEDGIYLILYSLCNFNCVFCDRAKISYKINFEGSDTKLIQVRELLDGEDLNKYKFIRVGGNEPLTNIYIEDILNYLDSLGIKIILFTSGSEYSKIDFLLSLKNLYKVYFPLYGDNKNIHDGVVGVKGSFDKLKVMEKKLKENNIKVSHNRLIISSNIKNKNYYRNKSFNLLHPRDEKLYKDNCVYLSDLFYEINEDIILKYYLELGIPVCIKYEEIKLNNIKKDILMRVMKNFDIIKYRKINENIFDSYSKPDKCKDCYLDKYCFGYFKFYFDKFGEKEIKPIKKDKIGK